MNLRLVFIVLLLCATPRIAHAQASEEEMNAALERYAGEPSVEDVVRLTLKQSKRDPDTLASLVTRARLRGLIPSLRVGVRRGQGQDRSDLTAGTVTYGSADDLSLQAWATFDFGRLLFADEEVALARDARAAEGDRRELIRTVVSLYFERRRLQLEADLNHDHNVAHALRIQEITALLNVFTGGAFRRTMRAP